MPFHSELKYEPASGTNIWGRPQYKLVEPLLYSYGKDVEVTVPAGFKTDFATVPWWLPFIRPKNGKWAKASVVHDFLCKQDMSMKEADRIFYYAMLDDKASVFTAYVLWIGVRINHLAQGLG